MKLFFKAAIVALSIAASSIEAARSVVHARVNEHGVLDLSRNNIRDLYFLFDIQNPEAIKKINLSYNGIKEIPASIFDRFTQLEALDLSHNKIQVFPPYVFDRLQQLKVLNFSYNVINRLNAFMFDQLSSLRILDLSYNKLRSVPAGVFDRLSRAKIKLNHNRLR